MIKKLLGLAAKRTEDGAFSPSPLSLLLATSAKTDYQPVDFPRQPLTSRKKIIVVFTEESHLKMKNGTVFSTGNHPVESLLPMLHLRNAGFEFEILTPTGKPVQFEMWAMPSRDEAVKGIYQDYLPQFEKPGSLAERIDTIIGNSADYLAIYFPGGHGALLGLPTDENVGKLIHWAFNSGIYNLAICHGPAAFLAAKPKSPSGSFIYAGYKIAAFPDSVDRKTPLIGYMPGQLTWYFGEQLEALGISIINSKADDSCCIDRKLITAASPKAANKFGIVCAQELLSAGNGTEKDSD